MTDVTQAYCIYCLENVADTKDHVPPKLMLRKPYPNNLLTVPACSSCNQSFSLDEEYFRNMIVGMFCHTEGADFLFDGPISRSFDRREHLEDTFFSVLGVKDGKPYVKIEQHRFDRVAKKIIAGLYYIEKNKVLRKSCRIQVTFSEVNNLHAHPATLVSAPFDSRYSPDFSYRFAGELWQLVFYESFQCVGLLVRL